MLLKEFKDLRRKPDKRIGTPDLFNFAFMGAPGVMVLKDGALMTCLTYQGPDLNSASQLEISALKHHLNAILSRYGDGFMIHADLIRHPSTEYPTGGAFPDPTTRLIERERELHYVAEGRHLETGFSLSLTYRPPSDYQSRATRPFLSRHGEDKPDWHRTIENFQEAATEFEQALSNHFRVRPMDDGEMLSFLESCILGSPMYVRPPASLNYLDAVLGNYRFVTGFTPTIDSRHIRIVAPAGFPLESHAEITAFLGELPFCYRWSIRAIMLDPTTGVQQLSVLRRNWFQKRLDFKAFLKESFGGSSSAPAFQNQHALDMAADADNAVAEAHSGRVHYCYLTMVIGPTGAGKSVLLCTTIAQAFRVPGMQVFNFDKGYSSFVLTKACGGDHLDIGEDEIAACPLIGVDNEGERTWAHEYLEALLQLQNMKISPPQRKALWRALELLGESPKHARTFTHLLATVQDQDLREGLSGYSMTGPLGRFLDADQDALLNSRFITFELETLMAMGQKVLIPVLLYLFHRIDQRLDGRPTLVVLDEAWIMLANELFGAKIEEWLRTLRKKNAAVILATQSLTEVANSPYRDVILESCPTKIYLPNPEARNPNTGELYHRFGLSPRQIEIIADAIPKRHYYYASPLGRRLFDLALEPATLSFVGASSKEDILKARGMMREYGGNWPAQWLRSKGLREWAGHWEKLRGMAEHDREDPSAGLLSNGDAGYASGDNEVHFEG